MHKIQRFTHKLGAGLLMAGAAVGVSHLVQSTRAGVDYGFVAIVVVLLTNLLKYPFYEYGHRYAAETQQNLLDGYRKLGKGYLCSFLILNLVTATGSIAVLAFVTAALLQYILLPMFSLATIAAGVLGGSWLILRIGHYHWLERIIKGLMLILTVATIIAVTVGGFAFTGDDAVLKSFFDPKNLPFLIALMGWMPGPMEISVWQSLWVQAEGRDRGQAVSKQDALLDFNVGYLLTAVLACLFVAIGALALQGQVLSDKPSKFAGQVVSMYGGIIGEWITPVVAIAAVAAIFSTTFTLLDAYPRSLSVGFKILFPNLNEPKLRHILSAIAAITAVFIISQLSGSLRFLVDVVTILAFLTAPYFAWLNMRCIRQLDVQPPKWIKMLSSVGMGYLIGFSALYLILLIT